MSYPESSPRDVDARPQPFTNRPSDAKRQYSGTLFTLWTWEQDVPGAGVRVFEQISRPDTVLVIPITADGQVLLCKERQPNSKTIVHTLGGRVEPGELPREGARRELLEETGYTADYWTLWRAWQPVTRMDWAVYIFFAAGLNSSSESAPEPGEDITIRAFPVSDLLNGALIDLIDDPQLKYQLATTALDEHEKRSLNDIIDVLLDTH